MKRVVLISSMGGSDENNPLNRLGGGKVLVWKRVAEEYLIDSKSFTYTILHPGGLIDDEVEHTIVQTCFSCSRRPEELWLPPPLNFEEAACPRCKHKASYQ